MTDVVIIIWEKKIQLYYFTSPEGCLGGQCNEEIKDNKGGEDDRLIWIDGGQHTGRADRRQARMPAKQIDGRRRPANRIDWRRWKSGEPKRPFSV